LTNCINFVDEFELDFTRVRLFYHFEFKDFTKACKSLWRVKNHSVSFPTESSGGNFEFLSPGLLDEFLDDLHYGYNFIA